MKPVTSHTPDMEHVLHHELSTILPAFIGRQDALTRIQLEPFGQPSWYGAETVRVYLESGHEMTIFLKNFGSSEGHRTHHGLILPTVGVNRSDLGTRRERELGVYRNLIGRGDLGSPAYIGDVWKPYAERYWLLLEFVHGSILQFQSDLTSWVDAAGWLGILQGHFASRMNDVVRAPYLVRHDDSHFEIRGHHALRDVAQILPSETRRLERVLAHYPTITGLMRSLPPTLVHGNYISRNIVIGQWGEGRRICPVDWEEAAVGSPLYDLAFLCDGFTSPLLDQMIDEYRLNATSAGISLPDIARMMEIIHAIRLYRLILYLSRSVEKQFTPASVMKLLSKAEDLAAHV